MKKRNVLIAVFVIIAALIAFHFGFNYVVPIIQDLHS
jgi:hypothetical protein